MKKFYSVVFMFLLIVGQLSAQISQGGTPLSFSRTDLQETIDVRIVAPPDMEQIVMEDMENDGKGMAYRTGIIIPVHLSPSNSGTWETLENGDLLWRLQIDQDGPEASSLYFDQFFMPVGAKLFVYTPDKSFVIGAFTEVNNHESSLMATQMTPGGSTIIELYLPNNQADNYKLEITEVGYHYRATGYVTDPSKDLSCMVNIKCPPADAWQNQARGVARVDIRIGSLAFLCSGSLVASANSSCQPYFLLADHCAYYNGYATTANLNQWIFRFNYQSSACTGTSSSYAHAQTGCSYKANSGTGNSTTSKSDFYFVLLNNIPSSTYEVYYNGWSRSTTAATSGAGIHHPDGVIKKFSIFSTTLTTYFTRFWQVYWANQPGYGLSVTYFGSSGSPIFNQDKLIVGTLTAGWSACTVGGAGTGTGPNEPDIYGKFSYHWDQTGTAYDRQLKPWLDPKSTNPMTKTGYNYNACVNDASVDDFPAPNLNIAIFPNPADDMISVEFENYQFTDGFVKIIDIMGNVVSQLSVENASDEIRIPVEQLSNGLYFVNISNTEHTFSKSFMITR